jgi:two-component system, sensor histidine kinase and response regulator
VLASSVGAPISTKRAAGAGFGAILTKPVRHQALVDCLSNLLAGPLAASPAEASFEPLKAAPEAYGRVLLAEDNAINTLLATTLIEAAGYTVETVVNGAEAFLSVVAHYIGRENGETAQPDHQQRAARR